MFFYAFSRTYMLKFSACYEFFPGYYLIPLDLEANLGAPMTPSTGCKNNYAYLKTITPLYTVITAMTQEV